MRTITVYELAAALNCDERNVRKREGTSLPRPISEGKPRLYALVDVLWIVDGVEREQICKAVGVPPATVRALMMSSVEPSGYVPGGDEDSDALMH